MTQLDLALIFIMAVSAFLAMLRGFSREILSLASWGVALGAGAVAFLYYGDLGRKYIYDHEVIGPAALGAIAALLGLIIAQLVTMKLSDMLLNTRVGAIDRTLGIFFGLVRGLILVVVLYVFYAQLVPPDDHKKWVKNAWSLPLIQSTGNMIVNLLPVDIYEYLHKNKDDQEA